jgi:hypothetical protein
MNVISANIEIRYAGDGEKTLRVQINGEAVTHERTRRKYCSAADATTSARHLLVEFEKRNPMKGAKR